MRRLPALWLALGLLARPIPSTGAEADPLPAAAEGWKVELVAKAPQILFPTAIVAAPDGTVYLGQDPMDMPGPVNAPIDSIVAIKGGKITVFAEKLWAVMGLEWVDDTLYVVHAPFLSALRDTNGDGVADSRVDLITGLGPKEPGFNGINDHIASGVRLGMDGFLYIAVGDKGIPKGVGKDGKAIQMFGGGVIRIRPDGSDLEVVSTGERNPLSVALTAADDVFTYGNDDDGKKWPNSLTHHVVGGHYGYPYQFLAAPERCLPIVAGQLGGSGTQGVCYEEAGLPARYRGNLFFCDWGLQTVFRNEVAKAGASFTLAKREPLVTKGDVADFRPFSIAVAPDGASLYLVDWAFHGWLADGPKTGRLYRLSYQGADKPTVSARPEGEDLRSLSDPSRAVRVQTQRAFAKKGAEAIAPLGGVLKRGGVGGVHALWALDAIGTKEARELIRSAMSQPDVNVRLQAARCLGIRRDREALAPLSTALRDADAPLRREAAIALGRISEPRAATPLMAALGDPDLTVAWSVRRAIRNLDAWQAPALTAAILDPRRRDDAIKLCDESWAIPAVEALSAALVQVREAPARAKIVATLAGQYRRYPAWSGTWFGTNPLAGEVPRKTLDWDKTGMEQVVAGLGRGLKDLDAEVRGAAIAGLLAVGPKSAPLLVQAIAREADSENRIAMVRGLGGLRDPASVPILAALATGEKQPLSARIAAVEALSGLPGPASLRARFTLAFDPKAPAELVAKVIPPLGRAGVLPPNDLASFLDRPEPAIQSATLLALAAAKSPPLAVVERITARLDDPSPEVRKAAIAAVAVLKIRPAVPKLLALARVEATRTEATLALAALRDPRALPAYLDALDDRNPDLRRAAEAALLAIRDEVGDELTAKARAGGFAGPSALAIERILARYRPVVSWRVIGPFPRTTPAVFVGEPAIDFGGLHDGADGPIAWTPAEADPETGRVLLDDFHGGPHMRGGFGYDANGSPDLCAFGFAEVESDRDRPALLSFGSSGSAVVTLNETLALNLSNFAGRPYAPDSDLVRVELKAGKNRLLVKSRQGIGSWSFGVRISEPSDLVLPGRDGSNPDALREFALKGRGDAAKGEAIFFEAKGVGCVKCHAAGGRGTANIGPDLTGLASKYDRAEIIRSVLEPSSRIAAGYQPLVLATADGQVLSGLLRVETDAHLDLIDADGKPTRILKGSIDARRVGDVSLMPAGLAEPLSPEEFADLIAYLEGLKSAKPK